MSNVLFITGKIFPLTAGDALYSYGFCKQLKKICNLTVALVCGKDLLNEYDKKTLESELDLIYYEESGISNKFSSEFKSKMLMYGNTNSEFVELCAKTVASKKIDIIVIDHIRMAGIFFCLKNILPNTKFIYHSHNVEYLNINGQIDRDISNATNKMKRLMLKLTKPFRALMKKRTERLLIEKNHNVLCISNEDIRVLSETFGCKNKFVFNKPLIEFKRIKTAESMEEYNKRLLIIGSMYWYPNVNGTIWFINNVFMSLIKLDPLYKLYIIGTNPPYEIKKYGDAYPENIVVTGFVPILDEYFELCDISIIPIFEGTGAKIKVLESIARGIVTISSSFAAKDYPGQNNSIIIANKPDEFLKYITNIGSDSEMRTGCYHKMVEYYDSYTTFDEKVKALFCE